MGALQLSFSQPTLQHAPHLRKPARAGPRFRRNRWHFRLAVCGAALRRDCTKRGMCGKAKMFSVVSRVLHGELFRKPYWFGVRLNIFVARGIGTHDYPMRVTRSLQPTCQEPAHLIRRSMPWFRETGRSKTLSRRGKGLNEAFCGGGFGWCSRRSNSLHAFHA